jgi:hypothetical protein
MRKKILKFIGSVGFLFASSFAQAEMAHSKLLHEYKTEVGVKVFMLDLVGEDKGSTLIQVLNSDTEIDDLVIKYKKIDQNGGKKVAFEGLVDGEKTWTVFSESSSSYSDRTDFMLQLPGTLKHKSMRKVKTYDDGVLAKKLVELHLSQLKAGKLGASPSAKK